MRRTVGSGSPTVSEANVRRGSCWTRISAFRPGFRLLVAAPKRASVTATSGVMSHVRLLPIPTPRATRPDRPFLRTRERDGESLLRVMRLTRSAQRGLLPMSRGMYPHAIQRGGGGTGSSRAVGRASQEEVPEDVSCSSARETR
jgi:hypothetical protein